MLDKKYQSPTFKTDEEWYEHMESHHGVIVVRIGETKEQAIERCAKKGIHISSLEKCQCEDCKEKRRLNVPNVRHPLILNLNMKGSHV